MPKGISIWHQPQGVNWCKQLVQDCYTLVEPATFPSKFDALYHYDVNVMTLLMHLCHYIIIIIIIIKFCNKTIDKLLSIRETMYKMRNKVNKHSRITF